MMNKKKISAIFAGLIVFLIIVSFIGFPQGYSHLNQEKEENLRLSASFEGFENILITDIKHNVNISGYGLVNINDRLTILNQNSNPITSIFMGIHLNDSDNLVYLLATGSTNNALATERNSIIYDEYELITIYFDSPLLPQQTRIVNIRFTLKDQLVYLFTGVEQHITFAGNLFPYIPYRAEGDIKSSFNMPESSTELAHDPISGMGISLGHAVLYDLEQSIDLEHLDPFLVNLGSDKEIKIVFKEPSSTKMEFELITRKIAISPWGIIKVKEDHVIKNVGVINIYIIPLKVPNDAINIHVSDSLGELAGTTIEDSGNKKEVLINLYFSRASLDPDSKLRYTIEYDLPFEEYFSMNWFQESIQLNLITTTHEFFVRNQIIKVFIEGCSTIDYISSPPDGIDQVSGSKILMYTSEDISPFEEKIILFTFTLNYFDLLVRPITFILLIASILSIFVVLVKTRNKEGYLALFNAESIPVSEIREFCSLYEEKNALILEIRKAEEEAKRKKMAKKSYNNIVTKNNSKIEQLKQEIIPFSKMLIENSEIFGSIIKKLDVLDAERVSVDDSINLLDTRYKRGKLPSRAAYQKLSDDFLRRKKKIDRTIDKYIQQLRSYLL
ncbi:MAG: hypothetical protein KGD73_02140 [Candidatus Lokiarchaeota archaeon]|nr:hypothetical protein [Candidatus Lokiarchaeota archaeon]